MTITLWVAAEVSAIATDLAEFLGAALGFYLLFGPAMLAHGWTRTGTMLAAALLSAVAVFAILALDLAGHLWLERLIMFFVGVIGLCYGFEVFLVHPDWRLAGVSYAGADARYRQCGLAAPEHLYCGRNAGRDGDATRDLSALRAGAAAAERGHWHSARQRHLAAAQLSAF